MRKTVFPKSRSGGPGQNKGSVKERKPSAFSQGLLFAATASSVIAACACAVFGILLARSGALEPLRIFASAFVVIGLLCGGQLLFWRVVRGMLGRVKAMASQLSTIVQIDELRPLRLTDGNMMAGLVESINKLILTTKETRESNAELEFANRVLLHERQRIGNALDSVGDGALAVGLDGRVVFANRAAEPFLNVPAKEATGKPLHECVKDPHVVSLLDQHGESAAGAGDQMEVSFDDHASSSVFSVMVSTVTDGSEEVTGKCLVFRDIADMKRAEQARQDFVNSVAHELRTPLTSIKAYVEMLIDGEAADGEAQREFYNVIYEETDRLNRLIDNLLNMSRMELGTVVVDHTPTRLKKLIEDSLSTVESQIAKRGIQLNVDLPDRLPAVEVDKDMMNVVLVNILGNAVKYTPENGRISVSSTSTSEEVLVHVSDTGLGIAEEDLPRIFDKFFRCSEKANTDIPGSGLGLCIARQIMRLHGGDIRVSSRSGEGAQFTIAIPRSALVTSLGDYEHEASGYRSR